MKLLRDPLGRPIKRFYFKPEELDERCERIIAGFMDQHAGGFRLPIPTSDIIRISKREANELDLYADLPENIDGYSDYFTHRNPDVKTEADQERLEAAYRAFRRALGVNRPAGENEVASRSARTSDQASLLQAGRA